MLALEHIAAFPRKQGRMGDQSKIAVTIMPLKPCPFYMCLNGIHKYKERDFNPLVRTAVLPLFLPAPGHPLNHPAKQMAV